VEDADLVDCTNDASGVATIVVAVGEDALACTAADPL